MYALIVCMFINRDLPRCKCLHKECLAISKDHVDQCYPHDTLVALAGTTSLLLCEQACLRIEAPRSVTDKQLHQSIQNKLDLIAECWPDCSTTCQLFVYKVTNERGFLEHSHKIN